MLLPQPKRIFKKSDKVFPAQESLRILPDKWRDYFYALADEDRDFLENLKSPQGYLLLTRDGEILIFAKAQVGLDYGRQTLRQLAENGTVPHLTIHDWPDFEYRACCRWLLCGEATRWSYDWGDGREAFLSRIKAKLDLCLYYKINMVFFDGFTTNTEKYPGYAEDMRMLNGYARQRHIRLVFGFYGIGIGGFGPDAMLAEAHDAVKGAGGDYNRKAYPDGEKYKCCGNNPKADDTRYNGNCRSNEALNERKRQDVQRFVEQIRPGAIYIHHEDVSNYTEANGYFWQGRCDDCRKRWPNDAVEKIDGGAGAVAHGYDALCAGAHQADKECLVILASPYYGQWDDSDEEFEKLCEYLTNISKSMKHVDKVLLAIREQFGSGKDNAPRVAELHRRLCQQGQGHGLMSFAVGGAEFYANDALFSSAPTWNHYFLGAAVMFNFSGVIFQGLQEVFNAECSWNAPTPFYYTAPISRAEDLKRYDKLAYFRQLPLEFTAAGGIIDRLCQAVYGPQAGQKLAAFYKLGDSEKIRFPLEVMYYQFSMFKLFRRPSDFYNYPQEAEKWQTVFELTAQAEMDVAAALQCEDLHLQHRDEIRRLYLCLQVGKRFAEIIANVFQKQNPAAKIEELRAFINTKCTSVVFAPGNGEYELWPVYLDSISRFLNNQASS